MANEDKNNLPAEYASKPPEKVKRDNRMTKWFREMRSELKKVIWPTPKDTATNTGLALAAMLGAALLIWGFDTIAQAAVQTLIRITG